MKRHHELLFLVVLAISYITLGIGCAESSETTLENVSVSADDKVKDSSGDTDTPSATDTADQPDASDDTGSDTESSHSASLDEPDSSTFETDPYEHGLSCSDPLPVTLVGASFSLFELWSRFPQDDFDGTLAGCLAGSGPSLWLAVEVPLGFLLEVERTDGVQVAVNLLSACQASSCLASAYGELSYRNDGSADQTVLVAVEATQNLPKSLIGLRMRVIEETGETCDEALPLRGPFPQTEELDFADYIYDDMPYSCGWSYGPDLWVSVDVPPASLATVEVTSAADIELGYALICSDCVDSGGEKRLEFLNLLDATAQYRVFVVAQNEIPLYPELSLTVNLQPLPVGDTCGTSLPVAAPELPFQFAAGTSPWHATCPSTVCGSASRPDAWLTVDVPAGAVLSVERTAGPGAQLLLLDACDAEAPLAQTTEAPLQWSNDTQQAASLFIGVVGTTTNGLSGVELLIDARPPALGDTCGHPVEVGPGETRLLGSFAQRLNLPQPGDGCANAAGPEVWYAVEIPAGHRLSARETSGTKVALQLRRDCLNDACQVSAADGANVAYFNGSTDAVTVVLAVEAVDASPNDDQYAVVLSVEPVAAGAVCSSAIELASDDVTWTGRWSDLLDNWSSHGRSGCVSASGKEVFLSVAVGPQEKLTIDERFYPINASVHVVESCEENATCLASGSERAVYYNPSPAPVKILVVVEAVAANVSSGPVQLELRREAIAPGDACATAVALDSGDSPALVDVDLWAYDRAWLGQACGLGEGADYWLSAAVPAGQAVIVAQTSSADAIVTLATGCPPAQCLAYSDSGQLAAFYNDTHSAVDAFVVVRAATLSASAATMQAGVEVFEPAEAEVCGTAIMLETGDLPASLSQSVAGWHDTFAGAASQGCRPSDADTQAWYAVDVPAGDFLVARLAVEGALNILGDCGVPTCLASGAKMAVWRNDSMAARTVYLVAEPSSDDQVELSVEVTDAPNDFLGPDDFGYLALIDDEASLCPDISATGTLIDGMTDESVILTNLTFPFRFYGQERTQMWVSTNGLMAFQSVSGLSSGYEIPTDHPDAAFIAPWWDDLEPDDSLEAPGAFLEVRGQPGQRVTQIQYRVVPYTVSGADSALDFSVMLEESTGNIHLCYRDTSSGLPSADKGKGASVGIQGSAEMGLSVSYLEERLEDGMHVLFIGP